MPRAKPYQQYDRARTRSGDVVEEIAKPERNALLRGVAQKFLQTLEQPEREQPPNATAINGEHLSRLTGALVACL